MEHYVTLFDSQYLPQGLALHMSMERHVKDYNLWVLCVDDKAHAVLTKLQLPNVRLLQLSKLETEELLRVKHTRGKGEYCWTLTPFAPRFVFEADPDVERVTYLDADLWFRKHPKLIFDEFDASCKHVLITDHAYAPEYDQSATSGQYCVQFMIFTRLGGEVVRKWWEERCIDWCYARFEDGKFGDQKYLDDWPLTFGNLTHVYKNKEHFLAPWNLLNTPYGNSIVWHAHSFKITRLRNSIIFDYGPYPAYPVINKQIYHPYGYDVRNALKILEQKNFSIKIASISILKLARVLLRKLYFKLLRLNTNVLKLAEIEYR